MNDRMCRGSMKFKNSLTEIFHYSPGLLHDITRINSKHIALKLKIKYNVEENKDAIHALSVRSSNKIAVVLLVITYIVSKILLGPLGLGSIQRL